MRKTYHEKQKVWVLVHAKLRKINIILMTKISSSNASFHLLLNKSEDVEKISIGFL